MSRFDHAELDTALGRLRSRLLLRLALQAAAAALLVAALVSLAGMGESPAVMAGLAAALVTWAIHHARGSTLRPSAGALLEHLNRQFPPFEESAQLLANPSKEFDTVKELQRRRAEAAWDSLVKTGHGWLPPLGARTPFLVILFAVLILLLADPLRALLSSVGPGPSRSGEMSAETGTPVLMAADIRITPPAYTSLPGLKTAEPDLEVAEGSRVHWSLTFSRPGDFQIQLSDQPAMPLKRSDDGTLQAEAVVNRNVLYRLFHLTPTGERQLVAVHSLRVVIDRAPIVRIVQPELTELNIPSDDPGLLETLVRVDDEYGVSGVEIRASVASGAGEGVRFRDQVLVFDRQPATGGTGDYGKSWDLAVLGMTPGDELYFFVTALDNRLPDPNRGRSDTLIVRWLEENDDERVGEGLAIDVMPEYFKSQRQIIIETEQLIAERTRMAPDVFDDVSRALGQDQNSLKQRYGQYLGDETEGYGPAPAGPAVEDAVAEQGHEADHGHEGHEHDMGAHEPEAGPAGSAQDLIEEFMHDHGAADIGPITRRNPVGLMKRALSNMWQAELHLLLSEPDKALPFEYEALKYLNMARQAERIYTQRLGFEPPPVTEERRLSGELDDVSSYARTHQGMDRQSDAQWFGEAYSVLSRPTLPVDDEKLLADAGDRLLILAGDRPSLLSQAALLERWLAGDPESRESCAQCREELLATFWMLAGQPLASPEPGQRPVSLDDEMGQAFARLRAMAATPADEETK